MSNNRLLYSTIYVLAIISTSQDGDCQIEIHDSTKIIQWDGCILVKKSLIPEHQNDSCYKCSIARDKRLVIRRKGFPQRMYNCTDHCDRVTVCTHAFYNAENEKAYPLCYHCLNKKNEHINFSKRTLMELCSEGCSDCATRVDLPKATNCVSKCIGRPTFCFPVVKEMNQQICYQASKYFGCVEQKLPDSVKANMSAKCVECTMLAENETNGRECAYFCGGQPTWSSLASVEGNRTEFFECRTWPTVTNKHLFFYEVPKHILKYFHASSSNFLYRYDDVGVVYDGAIEKIILAPFNMTLLTFPRPKGFEDRRIL